MKATLASMNPVINWEFNWFNKSVIVSILNILIHCYFEYSRQVFDKKDGGEQTLLKYLTNKHYLSIHHSYYKNVTSYLTACTIAHKNVKPGFPVD